MSGKTTGAAALGAVLAAFLLAASLGPNTRAASLVGGVRFEIQYRGSWEGTWRNVLFKPDATSGRSCQGHEFSGSFKSSVRPGAKPYTVTVEKEGRTLYLDWRPGNGATRGIVTSTRTNEGWMLTYTGGNCIRSVPPPFEGCGTHTFAGPVALAGFSPFLRGVHRVYLAWLVEPDLPCRTGEDGVRGVSFPTEAARQVLDLEKLYRCGVRKPRGCRLTLGGRKSFSAESTSEGGAGVHSGSSSVEWSVTFVSIGKSRQ